MTVLLKGNATVVAAPDATAYANLDGTPWLDIAGSGDVLSGLGRAVPASGTSTDTDSLYVRNPGPPLCPVPAVLAVEGSGRRVRPDGVGRAPRTSAQPDRDDADAAQPNQPCRSNSAAILHTSPTSGIDVPQGSLVRILDYRGTCHYLARYDSTVGQLERSRVSQESSYFPVIR